MRVSKKLVNIWRNCAWTLNFLTAKCMACSIFPQMFWRTLLCGDPKRILTEEWCLTQRGRRWSRILWPLQEKHGREGGGRNEAEGGLLLGHSVKSHRPVGLKQNAHGGDGCNRESLWRQVHWGLVVKTLSCLLAQLTSKWSIFSRRMA